LDKRAWPGGCCAEKFSLEADGSFRVTTLVKQSFEYNGFIVVASACVRVRSRNAGKSMRMRVGG
jgi:hypothetical protein